ncbi:MAG: DUF3253 domain-containing protein [Solirubrobacterales bacterium]|nr:DUF3253 domain-containing protein [Solirubrobacterales bacterium]
MLEAKAKDLALLRVRDGLRSGRLAVDGGELVVDDGIRAGVPGDDELRAAILDLLGKRDAGATICPSETARTVAGSGPEAQWRVLMPEIRRVAAALAGEGAIEVTQGGLPVDPASAHGPVRLRLVRSMASRS